MFNTDLKIMRLINDKISIQYYKENIKQLIYIKKSKGFSFWDRFKLKSPITQKNATAFISLKDLEQYNITVFHFREFLDNNKATDETRIHYSENSFRGLQLYSNSLINGGSFVYLESIPPGTFEIVPLYSNSLINGGLFTYFESLPPRTSKVVPLYSNSLINGGLFA